MDRMNGITIRKGVLEATRTYQKRWWQWLEVPSAPCDGFLMLGQIKEKGGAVDEATYGVEEVPPRALGWRCFIVRKLEADIGAPDEQYVTQIGNRGVSVCSCTAGQTRQEICRHRCGLAAVIAAGSLPVKELQGA
jgi:hypothetical protein